MPTLEKIVVDFLSQKQVDDTREIFSSSTCGSSESGTVFMMCVAESFSLIDAVPTCEVNRGMKARGFA